MVICVLKLFSALCSVVLNKPTDMKFCFMCRPNQTCPNVWTSTGHITNVVQKTTVKIITVELLNTVKTDPTLLLVSSASVCARARFTVNVILQWLPVVTAMCIVYIHICSSFWHFSRFPLLQIHYSVTAFSQTEH